MSWFKKKKEVNGLPKLPELPELPKMPSLSKFPEMPELPNSVMPRTIDFHQEAIKSAISPISSKEEKNKERRTLEIAEFKTPFSSLPSLTSKPSLSKQLTKKAEPVYIRIDKFKAAIQNFQEIQGKIAEIESLLQRIKEMKQKEDEELRLWERELETIKARIGAIDKNIFSKLD